MMTISWTKKNFAGYAIYMINTFPHPIYAYLFPIDLYRFLFFFLLIFDTNYQIRNNIYIKFFKYSKNYNLPQIRKYLNKCLMLHL